MQYRRYRTISSLNGFEYRRLAEHPIQTYPNIEYSSYHCYLFFPVNPQVAEVDFKGNVYAKGIGSATITAKTNFETSATCEVKVNPVQATSIQIEPMSIKMHIGESEKLKATVLPTHTSDKSIAWTSSDENIVSVDPEGKITAKSQGMPKSWHPH